MTKRPSGPLEMGSKGKDPRLGGGSGGGLGGPGGSPQSRLWRRLSTGDAWSFSLATLSGLPEPGAELGRDRRSGSVAGARPSPEPASGLERFDVQQSRAMGSKRDKDPVVAGKRALGSPDCPPHRFPLCLPRCGGRQRAPDSAIRKNGEEEGNLLWS